MGRRCGRSNPWQPECPHVALTAGSRKVVGCILCPEQGPNSKTTAGATQHGLVPWEDNGNAERNQKRGGFAVCQPQEGHVGQEAKSIMTDKQVLGMLSNK